MRQQRTVVAVIPALNEEFALGGVLERIPAWIDAVVVADNGSTDATSSVARRHGALVVHEAQRGYGAACQAGIAALHGRLRSDDVVVFLDADGSDEPAEMEWLVDPILLGTADLMVGTRLGRDRMPLHQRFGTDFVVALLRLLLASRCDRPQTPTDLGPFRALRFRTLLGLGMRDRGFAWTAEMQARAFRQGLSVREVPVSWRPGLGVSTISGTLRGSLRAGRDLSLAVVRQALGLQWDRALRAIRDPFAARASKPHPKGVHSCPLDSAARSSHSR